MDISCFVVERTVWSERLEQPYTGNEHRTVCGVFMAYEDARRFVERSAIRAPYPMQWKGDFKCSGQSVLDGCTEHGTEFEILQAPLM